MKLLEKEKKEFVRIIIGTGTTGLSGIKKPIKIITVQDTNIFEIFEKIFDMIKKEEKRREKIELKKR